MNKSLIILGVIAGVSIAACFFLATYFFFIKIKNKKIYWILSCLFLAIGLRVGKSILFFLFGNMESSSLAIGYFALASIGPLLFFYIKFSNMQKVKFRLSHSLHFLLPFLGLFFCYFSSLYTVTVLYKLTTILLLIYIILSYSSYRSNRDKSIDVSKWNIKVILSVAFVCFAFTYQHLTEGILDYAIGAGLASLPIYYLFIVNLRFPVSFVKVTSVKLPIEVVDKIKNKFEKEKIFLVPEITLTKFSDTLDIPQYLVTKSIKKLYNRSFPETINYFRIENVKKMLRDENFYGEKIETLAFESGFNSLSVFYSTFKREEGVSPNKYRNQYFSQKK